MKGRHHTPGTRDSKLFSNLPKKKKKTGTVIPDHDSTTGVGIIEQSPSHPLETCRL